MKLARLVLLAVLVPALGWQSCHLRDRREAGRLLRQVEARTQAALSRRRAPSTMFAEHLDWLARARQLDPVDVGVPLATGAQYLLLRRGPEALSAYEEAARLEPRPEIDLNIGRARVLMGDLAGARRAFDRALRLNPLLAAEVSAAMPTAPSSVGPATGVPPTLLPPTGVPPIGAPPTARP